MYKLVFLIRIVHDPTSSLDQHNFKCRSTNTKTITTNVYPGLSILDCIGYSVLFVLYIQGKYIMRTNLFWRNGTKIHWNKKKRIIDMLFIIYMNDVSNLVQFENCLLRAYANKNQMIKFFRLLDGWQA